MSSLVCEFIINPVLRQARRFSEISRSTLVGDEDHTSAPPPPDAVSESGHDEVPALELTVATPQTPPRSRPLSTSTEETTVEEHLTSPVVLDDVPRDHLGFPLTPKKGRGIPEDDGMLELRNRIHAINAQSIPATEKARLMHEALLEGYRASQAASCGKAGFDSPEPASGQAWEHPAAPGPLDSLKFWHGQFGDSSASDKFFLTDSDISRTYAPIRQSRSPGNATPTQTSSPYNLSPPLGCQHYERNVKLQCSTCNKWYTCRFCHDAHEDHNLIRMETRNMLCMLCGTPQRASDVCINCGEIAAQYYCNICKLWENRKSKPIYHCNDCGICRRGLGLGKDFFHCKVS
ncbi:RING finger protein [Tolypocladium capitatum]|uniref:RING finger protein n=1 Tax=Tolypocladium capitatum TaxID=45235 RepID=A0A2K3QK87_9HYPO|nr:RING finger protein [Tolypocladium capitatum]